MRGEDFGSKRSIIALSGTEEGRDKEEKEGRGRERKESKEE